MDRLLDVVAEVWDEATRSLGDGASVAAFLDADEPTLDTFEGGF